MTLTTIILTESFITSQPHPHSPIQWLHNITIVPPSYRQNIWYRTNNHSKQKLMNLYHKVLEIAISHKHTYTKDITSPHLHKSEVLWKLALIFESITLFPIPKRSNIGTSEHIDIRLHKIRTGHIRELYDASRKVISLTPIQKSYTNDKLYHQEINVHR